jgi:anti-sigma-K factor RskA
MRTRRAEPHTLAGAYALDALTGADRARFERHLARCEQCAVEVSGLREATARLAAAAAAEPPPGLTERAVAAAAHTRQLPPVTRDITGSWLGRRAMVSAAVGRAAGLRPRSLRRAWMPRLALAVAAAAVVVAGFLGQAASSARHQVQLDQSGSHQIAAVLTARDAHMVSARVTTGGTATVVTSVREHALVFAAAGLRSLPRSRCYELWLMAPGGDHPAAMLPDPREGMTGPVLASGLKPGDRLGLTIEPAGGTSRPTSPVILQVAL